MGFHHLCRFQVKQVILWLWLFEMVVFVYFIARFQPKSPISYSPRQGNGTSQSLQLWRTINLDTPEYLDQRLKVGSRHGRQLDLYYEPSEHREIANYSFIPPRKHSGLSVNCADALLHERKRTFVELNKKEVADFNKRRDELLKSQLENCDHFKQNLGYVTAPLTETERLFPIAYSIIVYKDFAQVEMLLRAIYRPQNIYCLHVDLKSEDTFRLKMKTLAGCFKNVFITRRSVNVTWGLLSVLEPELICIRELWDRSVTWKYWINLTGQEFPLRTNYELVKILTALDGANNIQGSRGPGVYYRLQKSGYPPHDLDPVKGAVHIVASRAFADYILHNQIARDLLEWAKDVDHPDEIYFNTLQYNPSLKVPGSIRGVKETNVDNNPYFARFKNWFDEWYCYGKQVRGICVFGLGDLPLLATREELFANKFHLDFSPETLYCMQEIIYNRTVEEYLGLLEFNAIFYKN